MDTRELVIVGGGGHAAVVAEAASLSGRSVAGFLDDKPDATLGSAAPDIPRLGALRDADRIQGRAWIIAIGSIPVRHELLDLRGFAGILGDAVAIIHPSAMVSPSAEVGKGVYVGPLAVVHTRARIGAHAIVNSACIVEHDCVVGANAHIAPGAALGGCSVVGGDCLVGLNASVQPMVSIGRGSTVGSGASVTRDVPAARTVAGVPAKMIEGR